ncbi:subtilisin-like protease SBT4.14 [Populus alba x Populus x berolinensis]|uniref:Subtilisin-like protease SBT4.14 n=1 Tax=Populus alba x Populus x berolinensis TaxID=444605 RepID=A0AAD6LT60_9ROSI|nr:subtilisin-like protease SBT4.14 [Populus alba x Populus x berolinensis]
MVRQKQALTLQINLLMGRRHFDIVSPTNLSVVSLYLEHKNRKKELILNKVSPEEAILKIPEERQSRIKLFNTKTSLINPASNNMSKKKLIIPSIPLANVLIFILLGFVAATEDEQKEFYIVYLGDQPVDNVSAVQTHMDVLLSIKRSDVEARESIIYSYTKIFNAFAAKLSKAEASKLSRREEVLSVFPNRYHKLHTTKSWDFIGLPNTAKRNLKMERNIVVGLLDTGITPQSESFKDDGFGPPPKKWKGTCGHYTNFSGCNNKLVGARYFKLDGNPDPSDILSPVDVDGHGTHTSSTLAGNLIPDASLFGLAGGAARGAVPNARVAMYKVCWVSSGCSDMDLLAAFEAAIHDGVDVLSISIGGVDANYVSDGLAIGAFHAMKKGIITVASGGNDGPSSGSVANHAPWILTVAASGINREFRSKVELGNGKIFSGVGVNKFEPKEKSYPLVSGAEAGYYGRQDSARFCDAGSLDPNKVKGKLVLCELGEWGADSVVKGIGGKGIILESQQYLDAAQIFMAPATMVNATVSDAVYDYIHSTKFPSAMIHRSQEVEVPAPFVASFSSRGKATAQLPLVHAGTAGGEGAEYCIIGSLKKKLVKGKMVVCMRGMNGRAQKGEQVKLAGGKGMLLINTETGGEELFADAHVLPATSLGASAGIAVKEYMNSTKRATASIAFKGTVYGDPAPMLAAFSSRGPSSVGPDVIKPDVTAPGVNILAAWPPMTSPTLLESDKRSVLFNVISGTSMSCPHVSGLAALLKSVHKKWSPAAIKSALMTTAYATDNRGSPIADVGSSNSASATPFAFGSGHVDPERASDPGLIYDITIEDYLNYFCSLNYTSSQIAQVSRRNVTCPDNKALQPGDLNYPSFAVNFEGNARNNRVKYKRTLTNVGTPSSTYAVKVEEPNGVSVILEPKSLSFKKLGQKLSYNVTFVSSGGKGREGSSSFGSLVWLSGKYSVRSPIAVTWQ